MQKCSDFSQGSDEKQMPPIASETSTEVRPSHPRILIVDDEPDIRKLLARYLAGLGYECLVAGDVNEAFQQVQNNPLDLIITDISMPGKDGIDLLREIKRLDDNLPVMMVTGNNDPSSVIDALRTGADDYILKPFNFADLSRGVSNSLKRRAMRKQIESFQNNLGQLLTERTSQVQRLFLSVVQSLITALEQKDSYTNGHSQRVAWLSVSLAEAAGLSKREIELVHMAGVFHDLGKIGIRESVLAKTSPLTNEEYEHIKTHCDIGVRILEPLKELAEILPLVRHHHECFDGRGYPMNLHHEEIPLGARILSIADAFDAMISARPYREALSFDEAIMRLIRSAGTQFDPSLVHIFTMLAKSEKFLETIRSPFWTHSEGIENSLQSAAISSNPLEILGKLAPTPAMKSELLAHSA
jgi:response regulator RpfG family c-di-GMP phosphodiesterase